MIMNDGDWLGEWIISIYGGEIQFETMKTKIEIHDDGTYKIIDKEKGEKE